MTRIPNEVCPYEGKHIAVACLPLSNFVPLLFAQFRRSPILYYQLAQMTALFSILWGRARHGSHFVSPLFL